MTLKIHDDQGPAAKRDAASPDREGSGNPVEMSLGPGEGDHNTVQLILIRRPMPILELMWPYYSQS